MPPPSKRRKVETVAVEEVTFDLAARQEYLTGFHKRKLQRAKHAHEIADKRARAERVEERKKLREERKADLERHVQEVNALLRAAVEPQATDSSDAEVVSEDEWDGVEEPEVPPVDHEAEYIDEDKYTTVTVEAMDVSKEGLFKADERRRQDGNDDDDAAAEVEPVNAPDHGTGKSVKKPWVKERPKDKADKPKKKRKKFRYENKAERKFTRMKEKTKNSKQAKARREA